MKTLAGLKTSLPASLIAVSICGTMLLVQHPANAAEDAATATHFHPKGKMPSEFTLEIREGLKATLPFADKRDFDEAAKGFIAAPASKQIMADAGHVAWDMESYQWRLSGQDFASIHPSLRSSSKRSRRGRSHRDESSSRCALDGTRIPGERSRHGSPLRPRIALGS